MIPSYGQSLSNNAVLTADIRTETSKVLGLRTSVLAD
jgi:hypothetical protein